MAKQSIQLVKLNAKPITEGKGTKQYKLLLEYTRVDGDGVKKPMKGSKWMNAVTESELALLRTLKDGDELVITKEEQEYTDKEGNPKTAWNLVGLAARDTWIEKPKKPEWKGGGGKWEGKAKSGGYDSVGNQVGNCITNAIITLGAGKTMEEYKARMLELAEVGNWLRAKIESNSLSAGTTTTAGKAETLEDLLADPLLDCELETTGRDDLDSVEFEF
jgi:hypothetical protein